MTPALWFAAGIAVAYLLTLAAATVLQRRQRRRATDDTAIGTWTCPTCAVEVPLHAHRTVLVHIDTSDAELHEMTHEEAP